MAGGVDEEESAVDAGVDNVLVSHGGELFAEISRVLVFDVFHDWVPAVFIVDLVSVTWGIDDIETETDAVFGDDCDIMSKIFDYVL